MPNIRPMRYILLSVFLFGSHFGQAQTSLNDYKYVIVPKRFDDFKKENQYQTSTLIKHLFTQKGFKAVWEDAMPEDLALNGCKGLHVALRDKSSMFSTKTTIILSDCAKQEIFVTAEGKSKEKEYKASYTEAITKAMASFDSMRYQYNGKGEVAEPVTVSFKNDVKKLKEERTSSDEAKGPEVIFQEATTESQTYESKEPVPSDYKMAEKTATNSAPKATPEESSTKVNEPISTDTGNSAPSKNRVISDSIEGAGKGVLYAQEVPNGYQLVDSTPKILLKIRKTSVPDYYLAEGEAGNGVVYGKGGRWYFEYYVGEKLKTEELTIKF